MERGGEYRSRLEFEAEDWRTFELEERKYYSWAWDYWHWIIVYNRTNKICLGSRLADWGWLWIIKVAELKPNLSCLRCIIDEWANWRTYSLVTWAPESYIVQRSMMKACKFLFDLYWLWRLKAKGILRYESIAMCYTKCAISRKRGNM
jgi:hypothetical protein